MSYDSCVRLTHEQGVPLRNHIPSVFAESEDPARLVPIVTGPERLMIAVAGDPNRTNAYALSNDGPHGWWTARPVDHTPASDLVCEVPVTPEG